MHVLIVELMVQLLGWDVVNVIHKESYGDEMVVFSIEEGFGGLLCL